MRKIVKEYEIASRERSDLALSEDVLLVDEKLSQDPNCGDLWMERGLALAKQGLYREAADAYSKAIALDPFKGIYYRHRAHRFLSCYRIEDACADFTIASRLIPLNWDVWYHLGLAHFLLGDYEKAAWAYKRCYELAFTEENERQITAISNWYWITLQRLGKTEEAQEILDKITEDMDPGPNIAYFNLLKMYKNIVTPDDLLKPEAAANKVDFISMGFGIANYLKHMGDQKRSDEVIDKTLQYGDETGVYFAFGYIAAMIEKEGRLKGK